MRVRDPSPPRHRRDRQRGPPLPVPGHHCRTSSSTSSTRWPISTRCGRSRRPNAVWFRRADYLGDPAVTLDAAVREAAEQRLGRRPSGPIAMLGHLRTWGWLFNPVTFYFCFNPNDMEVDAVVAEVTKHAVARTPRLRVRRRLPRAPLRQGHARVTVLGHGSDYVMSWSTPGERISVHLGNRRESDRLFDAWLTLHRREPTRRELGRLVWRRPLQTYGVSAGIYRQALALARKGAPFHPHPEPAELPRSPPTEC